MKVSPVVKPASVQERVSAEEWQARVELAAFYRLVAHYGMTDLIYNHISLRVPGGEPVFLINPYGLMYHEITASSLLKIDLEGNVLDGGNTDYPFNRAGFVIHSAIHAARHDLICIAHTHTADGIAVSAMECGLIPLSQTALVFGENLAYHEFEGIVVDRDEQARLVAHLGDKDNMILRNHGLISCGRTIGQAFYHLYSLEFACRAQARAMAAGTPLRPIAREARQRTVSIYEDMRGTGPCSGAYRESGSTEWLAALRLADRLDPSFRT